MDAAHSDGRPEEASANRGGAVEELLKDIARAPSRPPPRSDPEPGARWGADGRYVVKQRLGRGGMGTVHLAEDTLLRRLVALKVLDYGETEEDSQQKARLLREARLAAGLEHERIARVYDLGEHDGAAFVAMEYVRGVTLREWMARAADERGATVLDIVRQIAEGLAVLHSHGVVHRDLKPENVMLAEGAGLKLLDFGLARLIARPAGEELSGGGDRTAPAFGASAFVGTPGYMAPEQCAAEPVAPPADVFALGIIVYELVTRRRPFNAKTLIGLLREMTEQVPPFEDAAWSRFPPALVDVTRRMLLRDPATRYADGAAVLEALRSGAVVPETGALGRVPLVVRRAALVVVVIAVGFAASRACRARRDTNVTLSGMVRLPGGPFTMGRSTTEIELACARLGAACDRAKLDREQPARQVTVSPFYLDQDETTNREFAKWLNTDPNQLIVAPDPETSAKRWVKNKAGTALFDLGMRQGRTGILLAANGVRYDVEPGRERLPVRAVTWDGAALYCQAHGKRLPTEAEWEFAARGATNREYPWGDSEPSCDAVVFGRDDNGRCKGLPQGPEAVGAGALDVTPEGVRGLAGNVSEWVLDAFAAAFYPPCGDCLDPHVDAAGAGADLRVLRGGSWGSTVLMRTTTRGRWQRDGAADTLGFRCAEGSFSSEAR